MATVDFATGNTHTNKIWSKKLNREVLPKTLIGRFIGSGPGSVIQVHDELTKSAGDTVYANLEYLISADGVTDGETLEGNESASTWYRDDISINELAHAYRWKTKMAKQRVVFKFRDSGKAQLSDWFADRFDSWFLNHVCGNTVQTNTKYTGFNATVAPSSNNQIWPASVTADQSLGSTNTFTLSLIDKALTKAKLLKSVNSQPIIRPVKIAGGSYFPVILHPYQVRDLRTDTSTGQWLDIQKAAMQGGAIADNPIFTGALGVYNGAILFEDDRIPLGCNGSTPTTAVSSTRRAVLLGAQSAHLCYGRDGGRMDKYVWDEESFDFGRENAISAGVIAGLKKSIFNSKDLGTMVISTYAAA
jgi:N4-gp56 family major capsid protein